MDVLETLVLQFEEETDGIVEYSKCALKYKDDAELAAMYAEFAKAEHGHAKKLLAQIQKRLQAEQSEGQLSRIFGNLLEEKLADATARLTVQK